MKAAKRITCFLAAAAMIFTSMPAYAFEKPANAVESLQDGYSDDENAYAIYPIPRDITYETGDFTLDSSVNVVCESGIDEYTGQFLDEILEDYEKTRTNASTVAASGSQILLGVQGSGGAVDAWVSANLTLKKADLFAQTDSYLLSAKDGTIAILGKDTDAAFYGLATLQMIFSSFNGTKFLNAQIEDYAGMKTRGFIEGMYGGWSHEGRKSLMRFGRDVKMNCYIWASKADKYHTEWWDKLYPDEQIAQIRELIEVGDESKVKFCWSIHAGNLFNSLPATTDASYETKFNENYNKLIAKFQQLYDAGVRKFAVLNDDFGGGSLTEVVRFLNKIDDEFLVPKGCKNLTYCMQGYNKDWANGGYGSYGKEMETMKGLNDSIDLFWTGDDVNAPITQETVDYVKEKTGHEAVTWLNYPVNEHASAGLFLGEISHYIRDGVTGLAGAMSNPSVFTEANKVALFQLAAAFWNNHNYLDQAVSIWENAFKYLQPEVYESYLTLARNIANCPGSGRVPQGFPESEYIKDELEAVSAKIQNGDPIANDEDAQTLILEFSNMLEAIETFRADCANEELINDMDCWLKSLKDVATAGKAVLEAMIAMETGDLDKAWAGIGAAGAAMDTWNTYTPKRGNNAQAGSKRLVPFIQKVLPIAKNQILPLINPSITFPVSYIGVIGGQDQTDTAELAKAFDGKEDTLAKFNTNQKTGDYFGIDLGKSIPIQSVKIIQGQANDNTGEFMANGVNFFHNAVLEYSLTGRDNDWHALKEYATDSVPNTIDETFSNSPTARYVRLRLTKTGTTNPDKANYYTHIWEFTVNGGQTEGHEETYGLYASEGIDAEVTLEQLTYSIADTSVTLPADGYIGIKMEDLSTISSASWQATGNPALTLQYSPNGIVWTELPSDPDGTQARYVRLYNGTQAEVSATLRLSVTTAISPVALNLYTNEPSLNTAENSTDNKMEYMFDGDRNTRIWFSASQTKGQYLTFDLGATVPVYDLAVVQDKNPNENPKLYYAQIALSTDGSNWSDPVITINNAQSYYRADKDDFIIFKRTDLDGMTARYLRILITDSAPNGVKLRINEVEVNKSIQTSGTPIRKMETNLSGNVDLMIDGDISTVYASATPSDGTAYIKYPLTEKNRLTSVTLMQDTAEITNATVEAEIYDGQNTTTKELGKLSAGISTFYLSGEQDVLSLKVTWPNGTTPKLFEIMPNTGETMHSISFTGDGAPEESLFCAENRVIRLPGSEITKEGEIFEGWSDGATTYPAGSGYTMGTSDVTLTAVWSVDETSNASVTVSPKTASLEVGEKTTLTATISPDTADLSVTWSSNQDTIVTVDPESGEITALALGKAIITATAANGKSDTCAVTVMTASMKDTTEAIQKSLDDFQKLPASSYTSGSYSALKALADEIKQNIDNYSESELQAKLKELNAKKNDLATAATYNSLQGKLNTYGKLNKANYTTASWNNLNTVMQRIKTNLNTYSESQLKAQIQALDAAYKALAPAEKNPPKEEPKVDSVISKNVQYKILDEKKNTATALKLDNAKATNVTIQATVKIDGVTYKVVQISPNAFSKASKLKSVTIGKNVKTIGKNAFNQCKKLNKVIFKGSSAPKISSGAFKKTASKITVKVPKKLKKASFKKNLTKAGMNKKLKLI